MIIEKNTFHINSVYCIFLWCAVFGNVMLNEMGKAQNPGGLLEDATKKEHVFTK